MSETLDISKPLFTKRGGVVTNFRQATETEYVDTNSRVFRTDKFCGIEIFEGGKTLTGWTEDFKYFEDGDSLRDLTNTPPTSLSAQPEAPDELTALRERVKELEATNESLEQQLRQAHKANSEAWKTVAKYQRMAAKGATR